MRFEGQNIALFENFANIYGDILNTITDDSIRIIVPTDRYAGYILEPDGLFQTNPAISFKHIGYNEENCNAINLTENEKFAMIAHELGHIYNNNCQFDKNELLNREINADIMACRLGLKDDLIRGLTKIIESQYCRNREQIENRIEFLNNYH